jgi:DNA processing protein
MSDQERLARIALACLVEPGTPGVADRVAERGAEAVLDEVRAAGERSGDAPGRLRPHEVPAMLRAQADRGVRVLVADDPEFPSQLLDLPEPPLALWVTGPLDLRIAALRSVAVVGARACTAYGQRATEQLVPELAGTGWAVVSGAAFGIDAAAHRGALAAAGPTVAVLACGVDVAYPRAHDALLCRIADAGALVSELPPGSQPLKHRFLARNRLIAALSRGTVVVEAAHRSGALATAHRAMELGRVVMAVPGPITSMASAGTNRLLHEQSARAVAGAKDVIALVAGPDEGVQLTLGDAPDASQVLAALGPEAAQVLSVLPRRRGADLPAVARAAGVAEPACAAALGLLEVSGLARRTTQGWCR